jgi:hypothetical protein
MVFMLSLVGIFVNLLVPNANQPLMSRLQFDEYRFYFQPATPYGLFNEQFMEEKMRL